MDIVDNFGIISGLGINWEKSALMPLRGEGEVGDLDGIKIQVVRKLKYLGITLSRDPKQYIADNLTPVLDGFRKNIKIWKNLPLSLAGRGNLIRMVWLPQLLYILHNSPIWIPRKWFKQIDALFRDLLWKGGTPRISLDTLQRQGKEDGLGIPCPEFYFLASQLQHMGGCETPDRKGTWSLLMKLSPHRSLLEALEGGSLPGEYSTALLMMKVWNRAKDVLGYGGYNEFSPLWDNKYLAEIGKMGKIREWEKRGITRLKHIYEGDSLKSFSSLETEFNFPPRLSFSYLQIRHALGIQFRNNSVKWGEIPVLYETAVAQNSRGLISKVYGALCGGRERGELPVKGRWEADVGDITSSEWTYILKMSMEVSMSPSQRVSNMFLLHRAYYTPQRLFRMGIRLDEKCPRCQGRGDFLHMLWRCPKLFRYWTEVVDTLDKMYGLGVGLDPKLCLLGSRGPGFVTPPAVAGCLFLARKRIAMSWCSPIPPRLDDWVSDVDKTIGMERSVFLKRGQTQTFQKKWEKWLRGGDTSVPD